MTLSTRFAAAAAAFACVASPSLAQTEKATEAPATNAAPPAAVNAPSAAMPGSGVTTGMSVKDNTGAVIGAITEVKTDAAGRKTATIRMGADTFAVETSALAIVDGAATVNSTHAEIKAMMKTAPK